MIAADEEGENRRLLLARVILVKCVECAIFGRTGHTRQVAVVAHALQDEMIGSSSATAETEVSTGHSNENLQVKQSPKRRLQQRTREQSGVVVRPESLRNI